MSTGSLEKQCYFPYTTRKHKYCSNKIQLHCTVTVCRSHTELPLPIVNFKPEKQNKLILHFVICHTKTYMNMCIEGIWNKDAPSSIPQWWLSQAAACDREGTTSTMYVICLRSIIVCTVLQQTWHKWSG